MAPQLELPRISQFTKILAAPEEMFENAVRSLLNIEIPPGPQSVLLRLQTSIESGGIPAPESIAKALGIGDVLARIPRPPEIAEAA
ncbi:MAG: hypothetical protein QXG48_02755, partial [Thermofilaceae archaeon]